MPKNTNKLFSLFAAVLLCGACLIAYYLRVIYFETTWQRIFNSDHAIFGIMAKDILHGHFPIFFYGQNYMGPIEAVSTALVAVFRSIMGLHENFADVALEVGPLATGISSTLWFCVAIVVWFVFLFKRVSPWIAIFFLPIAAISSTALFESSVVISGAISALALGPLFFLIRPENDIWKRKQLFTLGLLWGFCWWNNQSAGFYILPIVFYSLMQNKFFSSKPWQEWICLNKKCAPLYFIALAGLLFGVYIALSEHWEFFYNGKRLFKIPNGTKSAKDFVLGFIVLQSILFALKFKHSPLLRTDSLRMFKQVILPFGTAFLIGYGPVWLGKILKLYPGGYGIGLSLLPLKYWKTQLFITAQDTVPTVMASKNWVLLAIGIIFVCLAFYRRNKSEHRHLINILFGAMLFNIAYLLFSERSFGNRYHYLFPAFFFFWILALIGVAELKNKFILPAIGIVVAFLFVREIQPKLNEAVIYSKTKNPRNMEKIITELQHNGPDTC